MTGGPLALAAEAIGRLPRDRRVVVAIDGIDGAGKTTFADRLAPLLARRYFASCDPRSRASLVLPW